MKVQILLRSLIAVALIAPRVFACNNFYAFNATKTSAIDVTSPPATLSDILSWPSFQANQIPIYFSSWDNSNGAFAAAYLDPGTTKSEFQAAEGIWKSASSQVFAFSEQQSAYGFKIFFSQDGNLFADRFNTASETDNVPNPDDNHYYVTAKSDIRLDAGPDFLNTWSWTSDLGGPLPSWEFCFQLVALHELGHVIGFAHCTDPAAVMYPDLNGIAWHDISTSDMTGMNIMLTVVPVCPQCPPSAPTNFSAVISGSNVTLTWNGYSPGMNVLGVNVYKNNTRIFSTSNPSVTSYSDIGAAHSLSTTPCPYTVGYYNMWGESDAQPINAIAAPASVSGYPSWSGLVYAPQSVTVNTGAVLNIALGTVVQFAPGTSLMVNGKLIAQGVGVLPIKFDRSTTTGSWGSIVLSGSGASGSSIQYTNIQNGTEIDVQNTSNVTIQNCNITNSSGYGINVTSSSSFTARGNIIANGSTSHGIAISNGSNNLCTGNTIYKHSGTPGYQHGAGIIYSASSGTVSQNDVDYYSWGIAAIYGASINFNGSNGTSRNNRVTTCSIGVWAYSSGQCNLGRYNGTDDGNGNNSIYGNSLYNVEVGNNINDPSKVYADDNWWGISPPQTSKFNQWPYSSTFTYSHWWTSDQPWGGQPLPSGSERAPERGEINAAASIQQSVNPGGQSQSSSIAGFAQDSLVFGDRFKGKNGDGVKYVESYVNNHPGECAGYEVLYGFADSLTTPGIIEFFKSKSPKAPLINNLLLANLYLMSGKPDLAEQENNELAADDPNGPLGVMAAINNMKIELYSKGNVAAAGHYLSQAEKQSNLIGSVELEDAEQAFRTYVDPQTGKMPNADYQPFGNAGQQMSDPTNGNVGLMTNYPNPFNPTTLISYKLTTGGHVTLRVYDVLGNEVSTLVNETQEAGIHSASFDGARLSSGIYFYRMTAPGIQQVKKMLLMK